MGFEQICGDGRFVAATADLLRVSNGFRAAKGMEREGKKGKRRCWFAQTMKLRLLNQLFWGLELPIKLG